MSCFRLVEEIDINPAGTTLIQKIKLYALNNSGIVSFEYDGLIKLIKNNIANYVGQTEYERGTELSNFKISEGNFEQECGQLSRASVLMIFCTYRNLH